MNPANPFLVSPPSGGVQAPAGAARPEKTLPDRAEVLFDDLTRVAGQICEAPIAAISLLEDGRQWFKSRGGASAAETASAIALCAKAILDGAPLIASDVPQDERFRNDPVLQSGIRFFAGVPLLDESGATIGTLAVMDHVARELNGRQLEAFRALGRQAGRQLAIGLTAETAAAERSLAETNAEMFRRLVEQSAVGMYLIQDERYRYASPGFTAILGYTQPELLELDTVLSLVTTEDRPQVLGYIRQWLQGKLQNAQYSFKAIHKDGQAVEVEVYESVITFEGRPAVIGTLTDVTGQRRTEAQMAAQAYNDPLTKLPNRIHLMERLELALAQARRHKRQLAVVHLDLDNFKFVNDNWGHGVGDSLLQSLALRLKRYVREADTLARIGGDEYVILAPELGQTEDICTLAQKLLQLVSRPFQLQDRTIQIDASIGIAIYPNDGENAKDLLRNADAAMYRAKEMGRNNFQLCTPELTAKAAEHLALQSGLRLALDNNEFVLHYQPLVSLATGRTVGLEALVRWQHPEAGLVAPGTFIPVAEETGLILPLGDWVLRSACRQLREWHQTRIDDLRVSVNFSARQFRERDLVHKVERALSDANLEPRHLEVEITESIAMEGAEIVVANLNMLRSMGVGIAIDDFGTGYSSMSYLKRYPVTSLKIDRSFVTDLAANPADAGIVRAIVEMAHGSRLNVIAEGVETKDQFVRLQEYGCDEIQGFWVSRPLPATGIDDHLAKEVELWSPRV